MILLMFLCVDLMSCDNDIKFKVASVKNPIERRVEKTVNVPIEGI